MSMQNLIPKLSELPQEYLVTFPLNQDLYLINGELHQWKGEFENVYTPIPFLYENKITDIIGSYPLMDRETALFALESAVKAYDNGQGIWPKMSIESKIECFKKFITLMQQQRSLIINLLMWEIGKTLKDSEKEFDRTIEYINDTIDALKDLDRDSSRITIKQGIIAQIKRAPLGVVLCMGPFNYPLNETFTTLIPALIMGNTVIFKPPKLGVLLHAPLLKAFKESFPKGVVNIVYGEGQKVIEPIMTSGKINVLAFIGTCKVADILKKQHPFPHLMKSVLGLEAKNPGIILSDANLDNTLKECLLGTLSFNGQRCTALKILFVHKDIYELFMENFVQLVDNMVHGLPWSENVSLTPLPEKNKPHYLANLVDDAINKGAKICNNKGGIIDEKSFFPVVLSNITSEMRIYHEEQFGPIIPIIKFEHIQEPLDYVINSNFGQQASIFGEDHVQISKLTDTLVNQVCRVNINSQCQRGPDIFPFTGRKDSAEGTLSVTDALRVFSIRTMVALKETDLNKKILKEIMNNKTSNFLRTDYIL